MQSLSDYMTKKIDYEKIKKELQKLGIHRYTIHNNGRVDVQQNVNLSNLGLKEFPVVFHTIYGSFDCSNNKLKSLKNGPYAVTKNYDCSNNELDNLEHLPRVIYGDFIYGDNPVCSDWRVSVFGRTQISGQIIGGQY